MDNINRNKKEQMTPIEVLKMLKSKIDEAELNKNNYVLETNDVEAINQALRIADVVGQSEQLLLDILPSSETIESNGIEGGLRDGELQMFWEGAEWLKGCLKKKLGVKQNDNNLV